MLSKKESVVLRKGSKKETEFSALIAIIRHKNMEIYCMIQVIVICFFDETKNILAKIYRKLTKSYYRIITIEDVWENTILKMDDINYVFVSHFHPDHIGNLHKFVNARIF